MKICSVPFCDRHIFLCSRVLPFIPDLQLDVKGCKDVYESFDKYVEVERLEGENKYHAEQFGLQVRMSLQRLFSV